MADTTMIQQQLDALADLYSAVAAEQASKQAEIDQVLAPEIRSKLAEIDAEYDERIAGAQAKIDAMRTSINETVRAHGATVKGEHLMAVFSERTNWDGKQLKAYAEEHPDVLRFRSLTSVVSIREVTK